MRNSMACSSCERCYGGEYLDKTATLSQEVRRFVEEMDEVDAGLRRDFVEEVREKARMMGKPVPMRPEGVLSVKRQGSGKAAPSRRTDNEKSAIIRRSGAKALALAMGMKRRAPSGAAAHADSPAAH